MKKYSFYFLLIFITLFPIWEGLSIQYIIPGPSIFGLLLIVVWLIETLKSNILIDKKSIILVVILLFTFILGIFKSEDMIYGLNKIFSLFAVLMLFIIIIDLVREEKRINFILISYVLGIFIFSLTMAFNIIYGIPYLHLLNRYSAVGTDPNNFAIMMASSIPILLYIMDYLKKLNKIIPIILLIFFSFLIISTASRGGVGALILILALYFMYKINFNFKSLISFLILILILIIILNTSLVNFIPEESLQRLIEASNSNNDAEEGGRLFLWMKAYNLLLDNYITGIGIGSFYYITQMQVHNTFIYFYLSGGLLSFFTWILIWILEIRYSLNLFKYKIGFYLFLCLIPLFLGALTLNWEMRKSIYIIFAVIVSVNLLKKKGILK